MKAYTSGGDGGKTSLLSGERVAKSHCRIEACGDVDELSSVLGALAAALSERDQSLRDELASIQESLFVIGAWLATQPGSPAAELLPRLDPTCTRRLESAIEKMEGDLPALQGFILPGGAPSAAWAHVARAVCRRAERSVVRLLEDSRDTGADTVEAALPFLNRLSNYLFAVARSCNKSRGVAERQWRSG